MGAKDTYSEGSVGGPTVWFTEGGASSAIVAGPITHPKAQSSGCGALAGSSDAKAWSPGISATVESLPAGFTTETLLHADAVSVRGPHAPSRKAIHAA